MNNTAIPYNTTYLVSLPLVAPSKLSPTVVTSDMLGMLGEMTFKV